MIAFDAVLARVFTPPLSEAATPRELLEQMKVEGGAFEDPIDEVIWHACTVDRLGLAFTAGYSAATRVLTDRLGVRSLGHVSLAATESGGAHPRAIGTRLVRDGSGGRLDGEKLWCTLAFEASALVVIARDGERDGRPVLRAVAIPLGREGLALGSMPETPFCPEVQHATVTLTAVPVETSEIADVDAYDHVLKPFRTIEDIHVQAALLAWLAGVAVRSRFAPEIAERAAALLASVRTLGRLSPVASATHLALAGASEATTLLLAASEPEWDRAGGDLRDRFRRDLPLLSIASKVRRARLDRARADVGGRTL
ncbi:MAG: acyl-CoA dehydrogenase [Myxococcales bacterium]|nr:acyl-CoA dehydrogenase [Myxococcales bacterium]